MSKIEAGEMQINRSTFDLSADIFKTLLSFEKKINDKKIREVEREISKIEERLAEIEAEEISASSDFEALSKLFEEKESLNALLEEKMLFWESLYE